MADDPELHVYGQYYPHTDLTIVGNREGLLMLIAAVTDALLGGYSVGPNYSAFCNDGEGYAIKVTCADDHNIDWYVVPYTADEFKEPANPDWTRKARGDV